MKTVDIIIPTYKAGKSFLDLMEMLKKQTVPINQIILMNTEERYYTQFTYGTTFHDEFKNIKVYHHSKREFDHGGTRNKGVKKSCADIFVMMTQDAVPADEYLIENLLKALENEKTAIAYARQLPNEDAGEIERFVRCFNYPDKSGIKSKKDIPTKGIKTYFCSNVCAAYKRNIFVELRGFVKHTIFNEDMIFAAKAVNAGYQIAYAANARVYHSHNYSNREQFKRNFDLGVSQADHPEVFEGISSEGEGRKLVKLTTDYLKTEKKQKLILPFYVNCGFKLIGYRLGKNYQKLPLWLVLRCTMNKGYWRQYQMKKEVEKIAKGYDKNSKEGEW